MKPIYDLTDTIFVITGAASGICAGVAAQIAALGGTVIGVDIKTSFDPDPMRQYDTEKVELIQADVTNEKDVNEVFDAIRNRYPHIDVLVNGVGTYPHSRLKDLTLSEWQTVIATNLTSTYLCTRYFSLGHSPEKRASIVNIASINGIHPEVTHSHYGAAKAGVIMMTKTSALDLADLNIRVNALAPGLIDTPGLRKYAAERAQRFDKRVPLHALGVYEDIGNAILFFASDASRWITGQTLVIDGGVTLAHVY